MPIIGETDLRSGSNEELLEGYLICTPAGGGWGHGEGNVTYNLYFVCEFSKPIREYHFFSNETFAEEGLISFDCEDIGLIARFAMSEKEQIVLKCGISYTDLGGARNNFKAEGTDFDFDAVHAKATQAWDTALSCVEVEGENKADLTLFYTCLYHALLDPRIMADADGRFRTKDGQIHKSSYTQRTVFSGWDVYKSEFPLLTILRPDIVSDTINSLIMIAKRKTHHCLVMN